MTSSTTTLQLLEQERFNHITDWVRQDGKTKLSHLNWDEHSGWLYSFGVEDEVMYIGLTERILRSRMDDYRHIRGEQTTRMRDLITATLMGGRKVLVYGCREPDTARLWVEEARLRSNFNPQWNRC